MISAHLDQHSRSNVKSVGDCSPPPGASSASTGNLGGVCWPPRSTGRSSPPGRRSLPKQLKTTVTEHTASLAGGHHSFTCFGHRTRQRRQSQTSHFWHSNRYILVTGAFSSMGQTYIVPSEPAHPFQAAGCCRYSSQDLLLDKN